VGANGIVRQRVEGSGSARARWEDVERRAEVAAWVRASCEAQGLPVHVSDSRVLGEIAELLLGGRGRVADERRAA
jgi:hypothetical protein